MAGSHGPAEGTARKRHFRGEIVFVKTGKSAKGDWTDEKIAQ